VLILLARACPIYYCVICVYAVRSSDRNFPINTYLLTYLLTDRRTNIMAIARRFVRMHRALINEFNSWDVSHYSETKSNRRCLGCDCISYVGNQANRCAL